MSSQNKENEITSTKPEVEEISPITTSVTDTTTTTTTTNTANATADVISATDSTTAAESKPVQTPQVQEAITQVVNNAILNATEPVAPTAESGPVKTLKDAFPNLDTEIIETILQTHGGNVDATFETLLGMSDPNYKPEENPVQQQNQLRDDEAFARQLVAQEANNQQPQAQAQNNADNEPLFNFQEDLPAIKEKVIEVGTAAKNKIMSFYNQLVSGESMSAGNTITANNSTNQSNTLERDLGNLNISDNNQNIQRPLPQPPQQRGSVDLYEWDGQPAANTNPPPPPPLKTSTSNDQLLADEEFARKLAREDAEAAAAMADAAEVATTAPQAASPPIEGSASPLVPSTLPPAPHAVAANINIGPLKSGKFKLAKDSDNSSNQEDVTFTTPGNNDKEAKGGFTIDNGEDDDLDDLFIRDDAYAKSKSDPKSDPKPESK